MKNKVLVRVLIITFCALALYMANLRRLQQAKLKIVAPQTHRVVTHTKTRSVPKVKKAKRQQRKTTRKSSKTKGQITKGSQKRLAQKIQQAMSGTRAYQVAVFDLNRAHHFAQVATTEDSQKVNGVMRLYLLLAVYQQEKKGKLGARTAIKIKKKDHVKGEKLLQTGMSYGIQYLRQAMLKGHQTAANALLRKVGKKRVNRLAAKIGARHTLLLHRFSASPVGQTTASDLATAMQGIYQGRVIGRQYAYSALGALRGLHSPLIKKISGAAYGTSDHHAAVALVQEQNHSYCVAVWANNNHAFAHLGHVIAQWFAKH